MKRTGKDIAFQIVVKLREYLEDVPFCSLTEIPSWARIEPNAWGVDSAASMIVDGEPVILLIEAKPSGPPRIAREAVNQLMRCRERVPNAYCVFGAPYISEAAGRIAREAQVGYVDLAGNCFLSFGTVYIRRTGWPNPSAERRGLRSLYSPRSERVLRTLMIDPNCPWKIEPLAQAARVSLGLASKVKRLLEDREWLNREPAGFRLSNPRELLAEWAENYDHKRNARQDFYSLDPIPHVESRLPVVCRELEIENALTGFSAAARMAPMVRYQRATAYVSDKLEEAAKRMGLKRVTSGANVSLFKPYDEGVLLGAKEVNQTRIVSPVQTYLDLRSFHGRGEEAAEAVLEQVIEPTW